MTYSKYEACQLSPSYTSRLKIIFDLTFGFSERPRCPGISLIFTKISVSLNWHSGSSPPQDVNIYLNGKCVLYSSILASGRN